MMDSELYDEIRGLGYEVELTYALYRDGTIELVAVDDGGRTLEK